MAPDQICWNGKIGTPETCGVDVGRLLASGYVYQRIHVYRRQALYTEMHLEIIGRALETVYGAAFGLTAERLRENVRSFFAVNRYPAPSNEVTLHVFPHGPSGPFSPPAYLIGGAEQLYYPLYKVWHTRPVLGVYACDYPFMGYPTSASRHIAAYGNEAVQRSGADTAVVENFDGVLTNAGDEPLFLVADKEVFTSPCADGAMDSVMRRLVFDACRDAGIVISEKSLTRDMLRYCDEVFTATPQGLVCMFECEGRSYFNLTAHKLVEALNRRAESEIISGF